MISNDQLDEWEKVLQGVPYPFGYIPCAKEALPLLLAEVRRLGAVKDSAYAERNKLVAALSKCFPSGLERHPEKDKDWEDDWRWIVFIQLPTGQASWHIHDSELELFEHLPRHMGIKWDNHTTDEKYARLADLQDTDRIWGLRRVLIKKGATIAKLRKALEQIATEGDRGAGWAARKALEETK